jgi:hypothetical protein
MAIFSVLPVLSLKLILSVVAVLFILTLLV